jgi:hypothetical protein
MNKQLIFPFVTLLFFLTFCVGCGSSSSNQSDNTETANDTTINKASDKIPEWLYVNETDEDTYMISTQLRIVSADNCIIFYKVIPKNLKKRRNDKIMLQKTKHWAEYEYTLYTEEYNLRLFRSKLIAANYYGYNEVIMNTTYNSPKWEYLLPETIGEDICKKAKEIRDKYYKREMAKLRRDKHYNNTYDKEDEESAD